MKGDNPVKHAKAQTIVNMVDRLDDQVYHCLGNASPNATMAITISKEEWDALVWARFLLRDQNANLTIVSREEK